ncbi:MAG: polysaccharide deacetylase family protein, partial [Cyclobacteriaceae bacterium]
EEYTGDVTSCAEVIGETSLFRPPYGRIKKSQIRLLNDFKIIMWDVLSFDYSKSVSERQCLKGVISATRAGSIIVFHDSYKAEKNMRYALPKFLDHFTQLGFKFDTLS